MDAFTRCSEWRKECVKPRVTQDGQRPRLWLALFYSFRRILFWTTVIGVLESAVKIAGAVFIGELTQYFQDPSPMSTYARPILTAGCQRVSAPAFPAIVMCALTIPYQLGKLLCALLTTNAQWSTCLHSGEAVGWACAMVSTSVMFTITHHQLFFLMMRSGMQMRIASTGAVYTKVGGRLARQLC
jgi:hypothetical protein